MSDANNITNRIVLAIPERFSNIRACWRQNTGAGYPVQVVKKAMNELSAGDPQKALRTLRTARIVHFGLPGTPDINGIAGPDGRLFGIEVKAGNDRQSEVQERCERAWRKSGAIYILARDVETALEDLKNELGNRGGA